MFKMSDDLRKQDLGGKGSFISDQHIGDGSDGLICLPHSSSRGDPYPRRASRAHGTRPSPCEAADLGRGSGGNLGSVLFLCSIEHLFFFFSAPVFKIFKTMKFYLNKLLVGPLSKNGALARQSALLCSTLSPG